jgi:hypothetical protein
MANSISPAVVPAVLPKPKKQSASKAQVLPRFRQVGIDEVMRFFKGQKSLQKMYAEHVSRELSMFISGQVTTYPYQLNTPQHIVDFVFSSRSVPLDDTSVSELFMSMLVISEGGEDSKPKRKRSDDSEKPKEGLKGKEPKVAKVKQVAKTKAESAAAAFAPKPGSNSISARACKPLAFALSEIPNFVQFFSNPRAATFSSRGGLHTTECGICKEVGFYTAINGRENDRKIDLGQRRWIAVLHDIVKDTGYIPKDEFNRLLEVQRFTPRAIQLQAQEIDSDVLNMCHDGSE